MVSESPAQPEISIIVPTLNEAANIPALLARIAVAVKARTYEVLVIDDSSTDQTIEVCAQLCSRYPLYLHVRTQPVGGLSGAAIYGLSSANGKYLVVMDADLQHPPERIRDLLAPLENDEAEFVIGSRYVSGGSTDQRWGTLRRINSTVATLLARPIAGQARDPMSGFFALRADTFQRAETLNPIGYKLALELLCKCRVRRVREVPIHFDLRQSGSSKLTLRQQLRFLDHLSRLYDFCYPRGSKWMKFFITNACGWLIAYGCYIRLVAHDVNALFAPTIAFAAVVAVTALFHMRSLRIRPDQSQSWFDFAAIAIGQWAVCALSARWVALHAMDMRALEVFAIAFGAAAVAGVALRNRTLRSPSIRTSTDPLTKQQIENPRLRQAA